MPSLYFNKAHHLFSPREISSRIPPWKMQSKAKTKIHDPRFDRRCGEYNVDEFRNRFKFLNDVRQKDIKKLERILRENEKETDVQKQLTSAEKIEIRRHIMRLRHQNEYQEFETDRQKRRNEMKEKISAVAQKVSCAPFLSKSDKGLLEMAERYKRLKAKNKVKTYLETKKRKLEKAKARKEGGKGKKPWLID
ncbi:hypothetical protein ACOME3_004379 [Neoechinorhynchus agilis]